MNHQSSPSRRFCLPDRFTEVHTASQRQGSVSHGGSLAPGSMFAPSRESWLPWLCPGFGRAQDVYCPVRSAAPAPHRFTGLRHSPSWPAEVLKVCLSAPTEPLRALHLRNCPDLDFAPNPSPLQERRGWMDGEVVLWALANQTLHELFGVFSLVSTVFLIMNGQLFFFL